MTKETSGMEPGFIKEARSGIWLDVGEKDTGSRFAPIKEAREAAGGESLHGTRHPAISGMKLLRE